VLVDEIMRRITDNLVVNERENLRTSSAPEHSNFKR
jgi:hypothetical protein